MANTIFTNTDVYKMFPVNLFCNCLACDMTRPSCNIMKDCKTIWFSTPPKYTIVRVNTILTSVEELATYINESLSEEGVRRGLAPPVVFPHHQLTDCLVVPPWGEADVTKRSCEVIVDAACGAAVLRGANVFAPGVLGLLPCTREGDLVSVYADSAGSCKRGLSVSFTDPGKVFVGNGTMKMSRKYLFQKDLHPRGVAVEVTQPASGVAAVSVSQSLGLLQNLPSVVCGHVLSPQPGVKVIDLCAAPGHKTTHLAALMKNTGVLVALDKSSSRVSGLRSLCQTTGADCVRVSLYDSTGAVSSSATPPDDNWSPPFPPDTFDHVLLDAPCSAVGQRPQIGSKITEKQISSYPKLQRKLFTTAVHLVRPGGSLVYSTCSLLLQENEDLVSWALHTFPHLDLVPAIPLLGKPGHSQSSLTEDQCRMVQRFGPPLSPHPEDDTIGFFIAKFVKAS